MKLCGAAADVTSDQVWVRPLEFGRTHHVPSNDSRHESRGVALDTTLDPIGEQVDVGSSPAAGDSFVAGVSRRALWDVGVCPQ